MVKDTSREAYAKLDTPTLDERVYRTFRDNRGLSTRREIADFMEEQASTISGSVNRLIRAGLLLVNGTCECNVTGRNVECLCTAEELT